MEQALLKRNVVKARTIAELPDDVLSACRRDFKCVACETEAYFNKGSWRQAPHFAAKNHVDHCVEASYGSRLLDEEFVTTDTVVIPIGEILASTEGRQTPPTKPKSRTRTSVAGEGGKALVSTTRGVAAVLRELLNRPDFATSKKKIIVGKYETKAVEFFVPFVQLEEAHADQTIGVWGTVFSAREGGSIAWLNRGDQKVTIEVPIPILNQLKKTYKFASIDQLNAAKFLLIGKFDANLKCRVESVRQLAVQIVRKSQ